MASARIYDFAAEVASRRDDAAAALALHDHLECPRCGRLRAPSRVGDDHVVLYECAGPGHGADFAWRINAEGEMVRGRKGNRRYP